MRVERLISLHFPKAGGTSFSTQLAALLPDQVAFDYDHDPLLPGNQASAVFPPGKRVVHGHFRPQRYDSADAFRLTFLREPVENLISIYYFWLKLPENGNPVHIRFLRERPDIFGFARYPVFSGLMSRTYFGGFDMQRFDFIGFHESRARDIEVLGGLLGLPLRAELHENRTYAAPERQALQADRTAMGSLRDLLVEDVRFYDRMRGLAHAL